MVVLLLVGFQRSCFKCVWGARFILQPDLISMHHAVIWCQCDCYGSYGSGGSAGSNQSSGSLDSQYFHRKAEHQENSRKILGQRPLLLTNCPFDSGSQPWSTPSETMISRPGAASTGLDVECRWGISYAKCLGFSIYIYIYITYLGLVARTSTLCCVVVDAARNCDIISSRCLPAVDLVWIFFAWYGPPNHD